MSFYFEKHIYLKPIHDRHVLVHQNNVEWSCPRSVKINSLLSIFYLLNLFRKLAQEGSMDSSNEAVIVHDKHRKAPLRFDDFHTELEASFPDIIFPRFRILWAIKLLISQTLYSLKLKPSYLYFQVLLSSWDC